MDSGTTLLRLPQKVFDAVVEAVARTSLVSPQGADKPWRTPGHDHMLGGTTVYSNRLRLRILRGWIFFLTITY